VDGGGRVVACRTSEIAIRIALGARQDRVIWLVLREGVLLIAIGVTPGVAGALALTRTMESLLYRLTPGDPLTLAVAALLLIFTGILAGYVPARRAARVQPWIALRYE
jgi:putative ABC transport system permease protein